RLLNVTDKLAQQRKDDYIPTELFVLASFEDKNTLARLLKDAGASKAGIEKAIDQIRGGEAVNDPQAEEKRGALEKYTIDLTARASSGKLDPVIGRDDEIRRTIQVLAPRTKTTPVLRGSRAPTQEHPSADGRAGRRQDRHCRGPRAAHHQRRSAGDAQEQAHPG